MDEKELARIIAAEIGDDLSGEAYEIAQGVLESLSPAARAALLKG
jgi:hypothetical protein